jgi:high-affinity iron transporter
MKKLYLSLLLSLITLAAHAGSPQQLLQLADYIGVDYAGAVGNGQILNTGEYDEMKDFAAAIREQIGQLPASPDRQKLMDLGQRLEQTVADKGDPRQVADLASRIRALLIGGYGIDVTPRQAPDMARASQIYAQQCAGCHGETGLGNGPLAATIEPRPTNFRDASRARQRSLLGLYTTITRGVEGTAMSAHPDLSEADRWSLAFYVGALWPDPALVKRGRALLQADKTPSRLMQLDTLTLRSPAEIEAEYGQQGLAIAAFLRSRPGALFDRGKGDPLNYSADRISESLARYRAGEHGAAYDLAVRAYLEGFELMEGNLDAVAPELRRRIEAEMTRYRNQIRHQAPLSRVAAQAEKIRSMLDQARQRLDSTTLSGVSAFASSAIILLREGLEALLVVAALAAFLLKTGRRDGMRYLYAGIGGALLLGVLTWVASNTVFDISGQQRELTEGLAALFAAIMLFVVGFWMHSKTSASQWKRFIETSLRKHLDQGTLWGIAGLSFVAVYREFFEVVLFYQALWAQADAASQGLIVAGLLTALALLLVLAWLILRFSTRLPLRQFFAASGIFMFILAFVFAGHGIAALQEAGKLPIDPVSFPSISLLGIYPNIEALSVQALILVVSLLLLRRDNRQK